MQLPICAILAAGLAAFACDRADATATANEFAGGAPVGTVGSAAAGVSRNTVHEVTIPAGTRLPVILDTAVGSDTSRVEQPVRAHLSRAVIVNGQTVIPEGSQISGVVTDATRSGKVKGRAHLAVRFDTLAPRGDEERYRIATASVGRTAPATKKKDALEIGAPAAGGAIIGGLVGGKKGALIGGAAGGGAGTAVVLSTRGKEVHLGRGAALMLRLTQPITIKMANR
jgi:hypothetical protein